MPIPVNGTVPANGVAGPKGAMRNNAAALRNALNSGGRFQASGAGSFEMTGEEKLRQRISVKDFGNGVGSGGDDRAAIQRAINHARDTSAGAVYTQNDAGVPSANQARYGACVWFPPGRYGIGGSLEMFDHIVLRGAGTCSVIQARAGLTGPMIFNNTIGNQYGMEIHNLVLDCANRAVSGIRYRFANQQNTDQVSPWPTADNNPELTNVLIFNSTGDALDVGPTSGRSGYKFMNIIIMGAGQDGILLGVTDMHLINFFVSDCNRHGMRNTGASSVFSNMHFQRCGQNGIRNEGNNTGFSTCQTYDTGSSGLHAQGGQIQNQTIAIDSPGGNAGITFGGSPRCLRGIFAVSNSDGGGNIGVGVQMIGNLQGSQIHIAVDGANNAVGVAGSNNAHIGTRPGAGPQDNI